MIKTILSVAVNILGAVFVAAFMGIIFWCLVCD